MKILHSVMASTNSAKYTIKSVSDEGTYYLVKDWRKNRELWVSKDKMDRHPEWWFTSSGKAKQSLKSLLSVMDEYLSDTFTVVDMSGNETPLDVKDLGFTHIPDYWDGDVDACDSINGTTEPNSPDVDKTKLVRQVIKQAKEIRDYFQSHNNNLNRKQEQYLEDLSDGIDNESVAAIRDAIENMKYNSKNLRSEQYNLIMDLYDEFNLSGGKFEGMGYPEDDIDACDKVNSSTRYMADMVSASDDDADESEWYDWWNDVDGYLMGWDKEFKQLIYDFRNKNGWPKDFKDPLCDKLADVVYEYVRTHLDELDIDPSENNDSDYREFAGERMLDWLLEEPTAYDFWADYKG